MVKKGWKKVKLGKVLELKYGKGLPKRDRKKGTYPVYGSGGIVDYHNEFLIQGPGIIVGRKGNVGSIFYAKENFFPIDTVFYIEDQPDKYNLKFFYYMLRNSKSLKLSSDAAVPGLNRSYALSREFTIPSNIEEQQKIASILSNYDDLIENNTKRIQLLEKIAKLIYDEWFVKFKFPGHEKVKFVDSELGKIPEGWEVKRIGEILSELESGSRPKGGIKELAEGIPSIGAENINGLGKYGYTKEKLVPIDFFNKMKRGIIKHKDVLLYKDGAKVGRKAMFRDNYPYVQCCINEHVFILRTNENFYQNYLYFWLDQDWMTRKIINLNTNAAQPGINQKGVNSLPILIPLNGMIIEFDKIIEPILIELFNLAKKNQNLIRTRDLLLPKLVSGEVDVSDLDVKVPVLQEVVV